MPLPVRELEALYRIRDTENLRAFLVDQASTLGGELGIGTTGIERLRTLDDAGLFTHLGELFRRRRSAEARERDARHREESECAVRRLIETARHREYGVELDSGLLLGPVLADRAKYLSFHVRDAEVPVERSRLLRARKALRPFPDVSASVDSEALRLRWRHGRGGLFLRPQEVSRGDRDRVLHVHIEEESSAPMDPPTVPVPAQAATTASRPRRGAWIRDVLTELDLGR